MSNFCQYLTNQMRFEYGRVRACCWIKRTADSANPQEVSEYQQWMHDIDDWVPECEFCYHRESKGMHSPRLESFNKINSNDRPGKCVNLELQIDQECNGACLICGPHNSTTWSKYNPDFKSKKIDFFKINETNVKKYIRQVKSYVKFDFLKRVLFLGGEPLRTTTHLEIIKEIEQVRSLKDIALSYTTNGSVMPNAETIELWKKFKVVNLNLSIDAVGEHFNYLRWPLQWHQVESNLKQLLNLPDLKVKFTCSYTLTPFNIFYHDQYVNWAKTFFSGVDKDIINPDTFFSKPFSAFGVMTTAATPGPLQEIIRSKYNQTVLNGHSVSKCLIDYDHTAFINFMNYVEYHDRHRNLNWRKTFPEIEQYFRVD